MTYQTATGPIGADGPYWDALVEGRLQLPRCKACGTWHWPAVWRCSECGSWESEWVEQPLAGTVFSYTRTHHHFGGTEGLPHPFTTVLVLLDTVPIRLNGVLEGEETDLAIGIPVTGTIARTEFGDARIPALRWRLV
ncbi:MAG: Zn-ribbon domain-containing OB-fold protein [Sphingomonadaceae bacterium]